MIIGTLVWLCAAPALSAPAPANLPAPIHPHPTTFQCSNAHLDAVAAREFPVTNQGGDKERSGLLGSWSTLQFLWGEVVGAASRWARGAPPLPRGEGGFSADELPYTLPSPSSIEDVALASTARLVAGNECKPFFIGSASSNPQHVGVGMMDPASRHSHQATSANVHVFSGLLTLGELLRTFGKESDGAALVNNTKAHLLETLMYLHEKVYNVGNGSSGG